MPRRYCYVLALALAALIAPASPLSAQIPVICQDEPEFRQFDFWAGDWDVFNNQNGNRAGENHIELLYNGCVMVEHWQAAGGGGGTSMNYYDNVTGKWRQLWIASNYSIDISGGLDDSGSMVLVGELHNYRARVSFPFRGTWTPLPNGNVRQLFERKNPNTGEWDVWFDGRYERRKGS